VWTENIFNPKRQGCTQAFLAPVIAAFSNFSGVMWTENFWCVFRVKNLGVVWIEPNSSYCSWACGQIFLCLKRHTNETKGSIQSKIDPFASFGSQTADNFNNSFCTFSIVWTVLVCFRWCILQVWDYSTDLVMLCATIDNNYKRMFCIEYLPRIKSYSEEVP